MEKTLAAEKQSFIDQSTALILKADYRGATQLLQKARKRFKGDFDLDYLFAKALGDSADELPPTQRAKLKKQSLTILSRLIRRLNGKSEKTRFGLRINFYYQAYRFRDLERVGKELLPSDRPKGLYAAGLGASLEADRLAREKKPTPRTLARAQVCALRGQGYWKDYFKKVPGEDYYFPYTLQAMCFAILGDTAGMECAIEKARKLTGRPSDYWEFEDIRKLVRPKNYGRPSRTLSRPRESLTKTTS